MTRYRNDPRWIKARYDGVDVDGHPFKAGEDVFYYPATRRIYAGEAAQQAARDFDAACFDEGGY